MSMNSSSNDSVPPTILPSGPSLPSSFPCFLSTKTSTIFIAYCLVNILFLLPLYLFVLCHGLRQWRRGSSPFSSSDLFALHMAAVELVGTSGCFFWCSGIYGKDTDELRTGFLLVSFTWFGQMFFHLLTCVERYLAAVHPVVYRNLRTAKGIRIRNAAIGCVWLLCSAGVGLVMTDSFIIFDFCFVLSCLAVISFCSLSVLRVLVRPGPGGQGGARVGVDQSKKRAFYTITAILGVLVLRLFWNLVWAVQQSLGQRRDCFLEASEIWFNLPSSLVLPLLFLQRRGRPPCT